jgi:hypothetical protein
MRTCLFVRTSAMLIAIASPLFLCAQFQPPTPEELKMTADPKAPGAAAVYLNVEETTNDGLHFHTSYARIKVLADKGKELATVEIPYERDTFKIVNIKARTIHSDGSVTPLAGKPEDLLISKKVDRNGEHTQFNRTVFTLPNVEVGCILEYRYDISYDDNTFSSPEWVIQLPYFVHKAHYFFSPFKAFMPGVQNSTSAYLLDEHGRKLNSLVWIFKLPNGLSVKPDAAGRFIVDVTDIPPAPDEEWMPPAESTLYRVHFYYKPAGSAIEFWSSDSKLWSKDVNHFAETSKSIKEAVAGLISPADSDLDKARKLYKAVQALDNTDYSRKKGETELKLLKLKAAKHAEDTWSQKSGDSEDIAMLYLAMLRAAGLTAYAEKIVDRQHGVFDSSYLSLRQLDNTLVVLSTGGKDIELDPGEKMCPFGTVNWKHSSAGGLIQSPKGADPVSSFPQKYPDNKTLRVGDVTIDGNGAMTGSFHFDMTGQQALGWRQKALMNDEAEVKKQFDQSLESIFPDGVEAHVDHFTGIDNPEVPLVAFIKAHGTLGAATSRRLMITAFFFETRNAHPFVAQEKRSQSVDMHYADSVLERVVFHMPAGFTVEGVPQESECSWPQHTVFTTQFIAAPGQVTIVRKLYRAFTFAKPEEYNDLRGFYQKVAAADQQQLVLTTAPAAPKGN